MNFNEASASIWRLLSRFFLPLPAGDAGSVCSGQQPRRSDAAEAGGADGPQSESHTGQKLPPLNGLTHIRVDRTRLIQLLHIFIYIELIFTTL